MTREEIIQEYEGAVVVNGLAAAAGNEEAMRSYELFKAGLDALRPITREQVEKMKASVTDVNGDDPWCDYGHCTACGDYIMVDNFCPVCGAPFTDKAVDMVMERLDEAVDLLAKRLEALKDA